MIRASVLVLTSCSAIVALACEQDQPQPIPLATPPDIEVVKAYESDAVEVYIQPELPFCAGDGARMDAHIDRVSADLALEVPPRKVPVYVVKNANGPLIADWCFGTKETLGGCFRPWIVMAKVWAIPHELNHVVFRTLNPDASSGSRFWFEAYASAWETDVSYYSDSGLAEQASSAAYEPGDHLVRWLIATAGLTAVVDFYAAIDPDWDSEDVSAAFEQHFGFSYEEALVAYEAAMPPAYPGHGWCDGVDVVNVPLGETPLTLRADCTATDTYAWAEPPIEGMYVRRVVRVNQRSHVEIAYSSLTGVLNIHPCLETPALSEDDPRLSGHSWYANIGSGVPPMGYLSTVGNLEAEDYLFEFVVPFGDPVEVEATIFAVPPVGE